MQWWQAYHRELKCAISYWDRTLTQSSGAISQPATKVMRNDYGIIQLIESQSLTWPHYKWSRRGGYYIDYSFTSPPPRCHYNINFSTPLTLLYHHHHTKIDQQNSYLEEEQHWPSKNSFTSTGGRLIFIHPNNIIKPTNFHSIPKNWSSHPQSQTLPLIHRIDSQRHPPTTSTVQLQRYNKHVTGSYGPTSPNPSIPDLGL